VPEPFSYWTRTEKTYNNGLPNSRLLSETTGEPARGGEGTSPMRPQVINRRRPCIGEELALLVALVFSALLTSAVLRSGNHAWIAWVSLLPLFQAIRRFDCLQASLAGGLWGACLYLFSSSGGGAVIQPAVSSLALLSALPAVYVGASSWLTRRIGLSPFVLAVGWMLLELALRPLGLPLGLVATTQDASLVHWLGGLLGYVFVAFIVIYINASLLAIVGIVRLVAPEAAVLVGMSDTRVFHRASQVTLRSQLFSLCEAHPRAPPV